MNIVRKIVVIGPESTGKSSLCEGLARHYQSMWCPEFAREYLLKHGMEYTYQDLLHIAKGQLALEDEYTAMMNAQISRLKTSGSRLFIDTDMYVMKVWCEFVFENCHRFILEQIIERKCDLYLLCKTDLPWVDDELREYPDIEKRETLYSIYKDIMINQNTPWVEISGDHEERLKIAIAAVNKLQ